MRNRIRRLLAVVCCVVLTACGGSGDSDPVIHVPPPFNVTFNTPLPTQVNENEDGVISFSVTGNQNTVTSELTQTSNTEFMVDISGGSNEFRVRTGELDRNQKVSFRLVVTDGENLTRQRTFTFTIDFINASFASKLEEIEFVVSKREDIVDFKEGLDVFGKLVNLNEVMNANNRSLGGVNDSAAPGSLDDSPWNYSYYREEARFYLLSINLNGYLNGQVSDTDLLGQYENFRHMIELLTKSFVSDVNQLFDVFAVYGHSVPVFQAFNFSKETDSFSLFYGNPDLGFMDGGSWIFYPQFQYIEDLLNTDCTF